MDSILTGPIGKRTCGQCLHWVMDPIDPSNLAAPRGGECHHSPPVPVGIPVPGGVQIMVLYPKMPTLFPGCGQHTTHPPTPAPEG